jgi:hypothetical protein
MVDEIHLWISDNADQKMKSTLHEVVEETVDKICESITSNGVWDFDKDKGGLVWAPRKDCEDWEYEFPITINIPLDFYRGALDVFDWHASGCPDYEEMEGHIKTLDELSEALVSLRDGITAGLKEIEAKKGEYLKGGK